MTCQLETTPSLNCEVSTGHRSRKYLFSPYTVKSSEVLKVVTSVFMCSFSLSEAVLQRSCAAVTTTCFSLSTNQIVLNSGFRGRGAKKYNIRRCRRRPYFLLLLLTETGVDLGLPSSPWIHTWVNSCLRL